MGRFEEAMSDYTRALNAGKASGAAGGDVGGTVDISGGISISGDISGGVDDFADFNSTDVGAMARLRSGGLRGIPRIK